DRVEFHQDVGRPRALPRRSPEVAPGERRLLMLSTPADLFLRSSWLLLALFAAAACALGQPAPGDRPAAPSSVRTSYREMPVRLCVPVKAEAWAALKSGSTRLVLHIQ